MNRLRHGPALRRAVGVVLLALFFGPWAALVHAVEHAQLPAVHAAADDDDSVWGHPAGSSACQLLDHLLSGQAPGAASPRVAGPPLDALPPLATAPSLATGPEARAYEARGPPPG